MAREKRYVPPAYEHPAQEEMTVVVVKFKGGPESMQKGFDAVNNAIAALGPTQPVPQRVAVSPTQAQLPPAIPQNGNLFSAEIEELEVKRLDTAPEDGPSVSAAVPKPRKPYTFMSDFNLTPDGVPSLKEYCAGKSVQSDNDKFLVAGAWIQTYGGTDPFTGNHLFTVFRAMEWKTQTDMTQPLRRLKSEKSYFENPGGGKWRLTGIGLEAAERVGK